MGEAVFSFEVRCADSHRRPSGFGEELSMLRVGDSKDDAAVVSLLKSEGERRRVEEEESEGERRRVEEEEAD